MRDDFIRETIQKPDAESVERKHRILFRMSDIAQNRGLAALRDSLLAVFPLVTISTIIYIILAGLDLFFKPDLLKAITSPASEMVVSNPALFLAKPYITPYLIFCSLIPIFFAAAFTIELSRHYKSGDSIPLGIISGAATFIALYSPLFTKSASEASMMNFPFNILEEHPGMLTGGVFVGLFIALINYGLYRLMVGRGATSPLPVNVSEALQGAFRTVIPGLVTVLLVIGIVLLVGKPFGYQLYYSVAWMANGISNIWALVIIVILVNIFAFFGIQGASSFYSIFWVLLLSASIDPPAWGPASDPSKFATLSCVFFFIMIGGTGSTLCLNLIMLRARSEQIRKLGVMSFIPSLMNANDLIIYGLPVAFNRYLLIPFFLVPLMNVWITYGAFISGFINPPELFLPPYLPAPLGAFIACAADWKALLICLLNIIIGAAVYSFFLSPYDLKVREQEDIPDEEARPKRAPM